LGMGKGERSMRSRAERRSWLLSGERRIHGKALSRILAAVVLAAVLTASLGLVSAQAQSDPVVMAYGARSINFFPTWLAQRGGFFEKYGVNVQLTELLGGP